MKIREVNEEKIIFDNDSYISFNHYEDCCEWNYADFESLDDLGRNYDFNEKEMHFEFVQDAGFRFGDNRRMFFVPCYSEQSGYYSYDIEILYNGVNVCEGDCAEYGVDIINPM